MKDPAVDHVGMFVGGSGNAPNNGRMFIYLEAARGSRPRMPIRLLRGCGRSSIKVQGAKLFLQAAQDVRVGGRASRTQFQYTLQGPTSRSSTNGRRRCSPSSKALPELRDVATDQQTEGTTLTLTINRDQASRYGLTPQLDRRHALRRFRSAPDRAVFHAAFQLLRDHGGFAFPAGQSRDARPDLSALTDDGWPGTALRLRQMDDDADSPLSISHQGQFPAITISFNLAQGTALGQATSAIEQATTELNLPATINTTFQGNAQAFQDSLSTVPMLILAALYRGLPHPRRSL